MAESMRGLKRSHRCTEVSSADIGSTVTVMGWVQRRRNLGSLIFIDLRDRSGLLQIVFDENSVGADGFAKAETLRSEYVIAVVGKIQKRSAAVNENLKTGDIEVIAESLRILSESDTPPFHIEENSQTKDEIRLKYRYLDLRRPDLQRNLMLRSKVAYLMRDFMAKEGFIEIETPVLTKSTPEGARDYLVPSRVHPGSFYALPQSPQLFKQLLMCSGYDRYFQITKCFRDEDLRADRQPEFTQADMELSFVDVDDVLDVNERLLKYVFKEAIGVDVQIPLPRMTWQDAMDRYGSDKPDTRFGMELHDVSDVVKNCRFGVFTSALENGGSVRGIAVPGKASMGRKQIDKLVDLAKTYGAKGLAYLCVNEDGTYKSSFAKFMTEEETLTGAPRGTAYHRVMELLDFEKMYDRQTLETEINTFVEQGRMTREMADSVQTADVLGFLDSSVGKRTRTSADCGKLWKEQPFVLGIPEQELYKDEPEGDFALVQGIIDVYFEEEDGLVVLDYKTDKVYKIEELVEKYHAQLDYYGRALEQITGKKVKEKVLYSFTLGEACSLS